MRTVNVTRVASPLNLSEQASRRDQVDVQVFVRVFE